MNENENVEGMMPDAQMQPDMGMPPMDGGVPPMDMGMPPMVDGGMMPPADGGFVMDNFDPNFSMPPMAGGMFADESNMDMPMRGVEFNGVIYDVPVGTVFNPDGSYYDESGLLMYPEPMQFEPVIEEEVIEEKVCVTQTSAYQPEYIPTKGKSGIQPRACDAVANDEFNHDYRWGNRRCWFVVFVDCVDAGQLGVGNRLFNDICCCFGRCVFLFHPCRTQRTPFNCQTMYGRRPHGM
jgi:hypothetical protein